MPDLRRSHPGRAARRDTGGRARRRASAGVRGRPLSVRTRLVDTPSGPARVQVCRPSRVVSGSTAGSLGTLMLGHGAGGGVAAPDLLAVRDRLCAEGWTVALVEQPYRVRGQRAPEAAAKLDAAWLAVARRVRRPRLPFVTGGRSSGARVACRTATRCRADAVLALAFPLRPPARPEKSRLDELLGAGVPVLVVQGERDAFGGPGDFPPGVNVAAVSGDHSLRSAGRQIGDHVAEWMVGRALLHHA